ncbi:MAG: hypothetical protein IKS39_07070 [Clostridia bacterium]|nr:hypothetical protein [Clostridia bacterium]
MTALKCDRCGAFCDIRSARSEVKFSFVSTKSIICDVQERDFCPFCTEELKKWMNREAAFIEKRPERENDMVSVPPDSEGF